MTESVGRSAWHGIEVRHLAALQALAEEASFHGAARRLGYSQPAVSQQLAALERIVGTQLVNRPRVSQPLTLTEAGKRLLVHARAVQASLATAEAELCTGKARLRVGTYQTVWVRDLHDGVWRVLFDGSAASSQPMESRAAAERWVEDQAMSDCAA